MRSNWPLISLDKERDAMRGRLRHATGSNRLTTTPLQLSVGYERLAFLAQRKQVVGAQAPRLRAALMSGATGCRAARQLRVRPADE